MLFSRYLILTLWVICYFGVNYVNANAGLISPIPNVECSENVPDNCNNNVACHDLETINEMVNQIYIKEDFEAGIYQSKAMPTKSHLSTYTLQYFPSEQKDVSIQLYTFNQKNFNSDNTSIKVVVPRIDQNEKYKKIKFNENGYSFGVIELTFDARENPDSKKNQLELDRVFYSCARVRLQKTAIKKSKNENILYVDTGTTQDKDGNNSPDYKETFIVIPKMVSHDDNPSDEAGTKSPELGTKGNGDEEDAKQGNTSTKLSIGIIGTLVSTLLFSLFAL